MKSYKNPIIIFNPKSAGGKCRKKFKKIYAYFIKKKIFDKIDVFEAACKNETINKILEIHSEKKNDLLITLGGDGSISTVCNGLMQIEPQKRLPILPVPTGSGNSLLLDFNIKKTRDALKKLKCGSVKLIDVLSVENPSTNFKCFCVNILGLGFISDIVRHGDKKFYKMGVMRYLLGTLFALKKFTPYNAIIKNTVSGEEFHSEKIYFVALSNTKYTAGKVLISPYSEYDDGLMDVIIIHDINRFEYLWGFLKAFWGLHINQRGCEYFKAEEISITSNPDFMLMPDGELEGSSPVNVKVIPKQIKMIV